jgi:hypothetical protein
MTRMIPPYVSNSTQSTAETRMFDVIKRAEGTEGWVCLHSLALAEHMTKRRGEVDFVLVTPLGIFCLEVKGGRIKRDAGSWFTTNSHGTIAQLKESPFEQASSAMFALERSVRQAFGKDDRMSNFLFGYAVVFPDVEFSDASPEYHPDLVYDKRSRLRSFLSFVTQLSRFARERTQGPRVLPTKEEILALADHLRGDFEFVPSLSDRAIAVNEDIKRFSEEQSKVLDSIDNHPRVMVEGGAGTGKTVLALEAAIREVKTNGARVLFLCFNRLLAAALREQISIRGVQDFVKVFTVFGFLNEMVRSSVLKSEFEEAVRGKDENERNREILPAFAELVASDLERPLYQSCIIDEAQDILNDRIVTAIDPFFVGGWSSGRWRVFLDANNQGAVYGQFESKTADALARLSRTTFLTMNCRNTKQISSELNLLTQPKCQVAARTDGPAVVYHWYSDKADQARQVNSVISDLISKGVAAGKVTILSPHKSENACAVTLGGSAGVPVSEDNVSSVVSGNTSGYSFSSVSSFKGLENDFILLTDIDKLDDDWSDSVTYVGMSRARVGLWIFINKKMRSVYELRSKRHLSTIVSEAMRDHETS